MALKELSYWEATDDGATESANSSVNLCSRTSTIPLSYSLPSELSSSCTLWVREGTKRN